MYDSLINLCSPKIKIKEIEYFYFLLRSSTRDLRYKNTYGTYDYNWTENLKRMHKKKHINDQTIQTTLAFPELEITYKTNDTLR